MNWIVIAIILFSIFAPMLQKMMKAYNEWQEKSRQGNRQQTYDDRPSMDMPDDTMRVQEVDPSTMTMAQRIELARQRARQQSGGPAQADREAQARARREQQARALEQQQQQADRQRQQQAAVREQARRRQQVEQSRRQEAQPQRRSSKPTSRKAGQPPVAKVVRRPDQRRSAKRQAPSDAQVRSTGKIASTGLSMSAPIHSSHLGKTSKGGAAILGGISLRKAMIIKEVLNPPIALREESSQPWA